MTHLVIGLFENKEKAGAAVSKLNRLVASKDISLIAKDAHTGKVHIHQVKETKSLTEVTGANLGIEIGFLAGVVGGISTIVSEEEVLSLGAVAAIAVAMGFVGATVGMLIGEFFGTQKENGFPPERAQLYKDKIEKGEVFVSVRTSPHNDQQLKEIFNEFGASQVHSLDSQK